MRILFVSPSFPPADRPLSNIGGMQRVAVELHAALSRQEGVELDEIILHTSLRWQNVATFFFLFRLLRRIPQKVRGNPVDVVLFTSMVPAALAPWLARRSGLEDIPMVAIAHGRDVTLPGPQQAWWPRVFATLAGVMPVSRATGEACLSRGLPPKKLFVTPNGIDIDRFLPSGTFAERRQRLQQTFQKAFPDEALLLCSVGRHVVRKGFGWFVESVMPLLPDDAHYLLAGTGPETETIAAAIKKHQLTHRVHLLGRLTEEELHVLYQGADLFVMPNIPVPGDMEGFGVVMLEAGLSGLPTVAARLEGIQDVIAEGQNGHLLESGDAQAFSEAISRYHHNRPFREAASIRAVAYVRDTFSWDAVVQQYLAALQSLCAPAQSSVVKAN